MKSGGRRRRCSFGHCSGVERPDPPLWTECAQARRQLRVDRDIETGGGPFRLRHAEVDSLCRSLTLVNERSGAWRPLEQEGRVGQWGYTSQRETAQEGGDRVGQGNGVVDGEDVDTPTVRIARGRIHAGDPTRSMTRPRLHAGLSKIVARSRLAQA